MTKKLFFLNYKKNFHVFFIIAATLLLFSHSIQAEILWSSHGKELTVQVRNETIKDVLDYAEKHSDYVFIYSEDIHEILNRKVSNVSVSNKKVNEILNELFANTDIAYKISGRQVTIYSNKAANQSPAQSQAKNIVVKGNVSDMKGEPMIGVSIVLKNDPTKGTSTDSDGNYTITVPDSKSVLTFKYIGYLPKEESIDNRRVINVVMQEDAGQLDEVVVVAYGTQKKESVVGAITTVKPSSLKVSTSRSMSNNLAGAVSGIIGVQRSGEPGYDNSTFWIRGISSFQEGQGNPLVLVDGIERSLNNIDIEEIESFSVLKDAAASAVYGVRGANGVILINTKRGEIGKPRIIVKSEFAMTQPVQLPQYIGAAEHMSILDEIRMADGLNPQYTAAIARTKAHYDPDLYPDVNWMDAITKDYANNQRVTLDVSGGTERLRYSFVAAFYNENGIIVRDPKQEWNSSIQLQRYNMRSNVDVNLTSTTLMRFNIGGYLQDRKAPPQDIGLMFQKAFVTVPFSYPVQYSTGEMAMIGDEPNPWASLTQTGYSTTSTSRIETLFSLEQDLKSILPGLKAKAVFSFDRESSGTVSRSKRPEYYSPASGRTEEGDLIIGLRSTGTNFLGWSRSGEYGNKSTYLEANLTYQHTFNKLHAVEGLLLFNRRNYDNGDKLPFRNQGMAGRASYTFGGKYIAEFNFGYNGSENLTKENRYGFFPSGALGWIVSEESFWENIKNTVSKLKLRASYGQVGNSNLSGRRFAYIPTIADAVDGYTFGPNRDKSYSGMQEGEFGVENLVWETVNKLNMGVELGLFKNVVDIQVDVFDERRNDIFMMRQSVPAIAGYNKQPWSNYGKMTNRGFEASVKINKSFNKDWHIGVLGTFTYAKNKITEMDEAYTLVGTNRALTGHPYGQLFGFIAEGLYTEDDFEDVNDGKLKEGIPVPTLINKVRPGDIKYKDVDGSGYIDAYDKSPIGGTIDPEIVYGIGVNISYKNFDLGIFGQGTGRTYRILGSGTGVWIPGSGKGVTGNILTNVNDRWTPENPSQDVFWPRLYDGTNSNNSQPSTWWLRDMSFFRVKNIELGYSLPKNIMKNIFASNARIFMRGTNLLTFSAFDLWDPEVNSNYGSVYPIMKSISAGFELSF